MPKLTVHRVRFSKEADSRLKTLKTKTGITPNLLCRIGFCLSLEEPGIPSPERYPDGPREINRYTPTGEFDEAFEALLLQRLVRDGIPVERLDEQFKAHMNRGVDLLSARVRNLGDFASLVTVAST